MSVPGVESKLPSGFGSDNRHITHFYNDGNLILDLKGMLFQVHKSILQLKSQTFRDMFSLSHVKGTTDSPVETITLHDDPHTFAQLLDAVYDGFGFSRTATLRECLEVLELAQKYEMVDLENALHSHLEQKLPVSASDPLEAYDRYREYVSDQSLALLVLRTGSPKLTPWAFYAFGLQLVGKFIPTDKATYNPPPKLSTVDNSYAYQLILLQRIISHTLVTWRTLTATFYESACSRTNKYTKCSRTVKDLTRCDPHYLPEDNSLDPVTWIRDSLEEFERERSRQYGIYNGWCDECIDGLRSKIRSTFLGIHPCLVECVAQVKGRAGLSNNP